MTESMFENQTILITGGTGSWGQELTKQLLEKHNPQQIIIYSRGELAQVMMQRKFPDKRVRFVIGDIRDKSALLDTMYGVDYVFHLAALKHVPICEEQPREAIKTNIDGTQNIIDCAMLHGVKKVIDVSTDKAVDPLNLYGMTKAVGERLIMQANKIAERQNVQTRFVCIRGGNVIGSNGSVIPFFIEQIQKNNHVTLTHRDMTRYFMSLPEAIELLFVASEISLGGETFVMKMPSFYIEDIVNVLVEHYGNSETTISLVGMRPGEKIDEVLVSRNEAKSSVDVGKYVVIMPTLMDERIKSHYEHLDAFQLEEYTSRSYVTREHGTVKDMLTKSGFIK